jgi:predicted ribosome quality control (RQC) complex YloA/Tae2 family protein
MLGTFYTLDALAREWAPDLVGCRVGDAFSQVRNELSLAFAGPEQAWMLRVSTEAAFTFIFRSEGVSKAKRNVATLFEDAVDRTVETVRMAERDRVLFIDLEGGWRFQGLLYGSRPNVLLVNADDVIVEAFADDDELRGTTPPAPRAAPDVPTFEAFENRWRTNRKKAVQSLSSALPLFDRTLAREAMHRAALAPGPPELLTEDQRRTLYQAATSLEDDLRHPQPRIYWRGRFADTLALCPLLHLQDADEDYREETFETVDAAVRVFVRRTLAQRHFRELYEPLEDALVAARDDNRRRVERMLEELTNESRAARYEHWGHLLMAQTADVPKGADEVTLPDLFSEADETVTIPLDPARSAVQNAERYYDKARRTRRSREEAEARALRTEAQAERADQLLGELRNVDFLSDLKRFMKEKADELTPFVGEEKAGKERIPFRRYDLGSGYEVWVGRNARQNDDLTFHHAQKYDIWMHARGVPGSHAVLRLPNRDAEPGRYLLQRAAAIAAYHSKARGSSMAPVMMTRRKYVRKPSGAPPGAVRVEYEDVVMVEPRLPENADKR